MAELHVEQKKRSNTMWIVIGVLLVALIAWMATRGDDDVNRVPATERSTSALPAATVAVPVLLYT